jgi:hypothetical protein
MGSLFTDSAKNRIIESKGEEFNFSLLKPKHSKKDYESITKWSVEDIINSASIAPK